jgi:heptosyltransferase-1
MGDVIESARYACCLHERNPGIELTWLVCTPLDLLIREESYVDRVLPWNRKTGWRGFFGLLRQIRENRYDWFFSLKGTDRSFLMALASGIPRSRRIGGHRILGGYFGIDYDRIVPALNRDSEVCRPRLFCGGDAEETPLDGIPGRRILCLIGSSKPQKMWPSSCWSRLICSCGEGFSFILVGSGEMEKETAARIMKGTDVPRRIFNLVDALSLKEVLACLRGCDLVIGGDTGWMHAARLMGRPAVGLFGPTLPEQVGLVDLDVKLLARCERRGCFDWDCTERNCLASINPEDVLAAMLGLLEGRRYPGELLPDDGFSVEAEV